MTVLRGLPTWRTSYQIENPKIPTHLHFDSTRFRHPIAPSMDELNRLADDYEWFLQAIALGVIRRKADLSDREASFQPRGQYLFEVEPGSGEWLQIGNEFAIRSNGLPPFYRDQVIAAVQHRLSRVGPTQFLLLAALMRHYQLRVYQPKLEVDETGAELPSPSLPNITARRLYDAWLHRAQALNPEAPLASIDRALELINQWSVAVPDSASDAYGWEVQNAADKRVMRPEYLVSEAQAASVFSAAAAPPAAARPQANSYKVFLNKTQQGPYGWDELARRIALGEISADTKVWNMRWVPHVDRWQAADEVPELVPLFGTAIPDPHDDIPDPE